MIKEERGNELHSVRSGESSVLPRGPENEVPCAKREGPPSHFSPLVKPLKSVSGEERPRQTREMGAAIDDQEIIL